jgi:hypothetical protein
MRALRLDQMDEAHSDRSGVPLLLRLEIGIEDRGRAAQAASRLPQAKPQHDVVLLQGSKAHQLLHESDLTSSHAGPGLQHPVATG